jgi:hypothetical protein
VGARVRPRDPELASTPSRASTDRPA